MSAWDRAGARAALEPEESHAPALPSGVQAPARAHALVVVDHFDPTMIDAGIAGALVCVKPLSRLEAMDLAQEHNAPIIVSDRILADVERELGLTRAAFPRVSPGRALLVRTRLSWNDVRWHHVTFEGER